MSCSVPTAPGVPADLGVSGRSIVPGVAALLGPGTGVAALSFWLDDVFTSSAESSTDKTVCTNILLFGGSFL